MHNKRIVSLILAIVMLFSITITASAATITDLNGRVVEIPGFTDTIGHWAAGAINQWQYYKVINGNAGKFMPDQPITRRDFAVVINNLMKLYGLSVNSFSDLELNQYYTVPLLKANAAGLMVGSEGKIRPHDNITREEAVVVLCRAFKIDPKIGLIKFTDGSKVSDWAYEYVKAMADLGYIKGSGNLFRPKEVISRAEVVTILNNMVGAYYTASGEYMNTYIGNGLVVSNNIIASNTNVVGNIYIAQGMRSGTFKVSNSTINGTIVMMAELAKLDLMGDSEVDTVKLYGKDSKLTGANSADNVIVMEGAGRAEISGVPNYITLMPGTSAVVDGALIENNGVAELKYTKALTELLVADLSGSVTGGPKISIESIVIDFNNNTKASGISIEDMGDTQIKETGILINRSTEVPSVGSHSEKRTFSGNQADYAEFEILTGNQSSGSTWVYRAYAVNQSGKIGYSNPISVKAYDYTITGNVVSTSSNPDQGTITKQFEIYIYGTNIPKISRVSALSNFTNGINEEYTETNASVYVSNTNSLTKKISYMANIVFRKDQLGAINTHNYYGYKVSFANETGIAEKFPSFNDNTVLPTDVVSISTGDAHFITDRDVEVYGNRFTEGTGQVIETGIVVLEAGPAESAPKAVSAEDAWKVHSSYTNSGILQSNYSVKAGVRPGPGRVYYYAAYVRTTTRTTYGNIKMVVGPIAPMYTGSYKITISQSKTNAVVELGILSSLSINTAAVDGIQKFVEAETGEILQKYNYKPLSTARPSFSNNTLKLSFTELKPDTVYSVNLLIPNSQGYISIPLEIDTHVES